MEMEDIFQEREEMAIEPLTPAAMLDVDAALGTYRKMVEFVRRVLTPGVDYGVIPGTPKPTMYKPGAEKLRRFFNLTIAVELVEAIEHWDVPITETQFPVFAYTYRGIIVQPDGMRVPVSEGTCNSMESKYRWRWTDTLPAGWDASKLQSEAGTEWKFAFAIEKAETTGKYGMPAEYWQGWQDDIAAGRAVKTQRRTSKGAMMDAWERGGTRYRIPNDNIYDQLNTLRKMAQKRAFVGAILLWTSASEFFTQDLEDMASHLAPEDVSLASFVPAKDTAGRRLMAYVRDRGISNPGEWIKDVLVRNGVQFSLDSWTEILALIDDILEMKENEA